MYIMYAKKPPRTAAPHEEPTMAHRFELLEPLPKKLSKGAVGDPPSGSVGANDGLNVGE